MNTDAIVKVEIDTQGRLCIYPEKVRFSLIWRLAADVNWDENGFLHSPVPTENWSYFNWTYFRWYEHIITLLRSEANCDLYLTSKTIFLNVPEQLHQQIVAFN